MERVIGIIIVYKKMARPTKRQQINKKIGEGVSKMTPEVIKKLEEVFAIDGSVAEACYWADISQATYYVWVKENPKLLDRFTKLRERPVLLARQTAFKKIPESYANAMDYLKRKKALEFGDKADVNVDVVLKLDV